MSNQKMELQTWKIVLLAVCAFVIFVILLIVVLGQRLLVYAALFKRLTKVEKLFDGCLVPRSDNEGIERSAAQFQQEKSA